MSSPVGDQMARSAGLFQAFVALPAMLFMGGGAMEALFQSRIPIYDFIALSLNALFATGIIFIVFVQRNVSMNKTVTLYFEEAKSGLATTIWLWLLFDAICGPQHYYYWYITGPRGQRIIRAAFSVVLLLIVYYPTFVYAAYQKRYASSPPENSETGRGQDQGEQEPLLN